jgi:hypothetical protein
MQVGGVNVSPESANHMLVSLNGILQAPTSSFTVSGSTITFASNLVTGDVIDFIQILGNVLDLGVPSDDSTVSLAKLTATGTKDATTFLRGDNTFAEVVSGLTVADQWRLTSDFTGSASPIASNLERVDTAGQGTIGTAMSVSSGVFTFPSTGVYLVNAQMEMDMNADCRYIVLYIKSTRNNGGAWTEIAEASTFLQQTSSNYTPAQVSTSTLMSISDTSNHKVRFDVLPVESSLNFKGSTVDNESHFTFIRLGDV